MKPGFQAFLDFESLLYPYNSPWCALHLVKIEAEIFEPIELFSITVEFGFEPSVKELTELLFKTAAVKAARVSSSKDCVLHFYTGISNPYP